MKTDKTLFKVLVSLFITALFLLAAGGSDEGSSSSSSSSSKSSVPSTDTQVKSTAPDPVFSNGEDDDELPEEEIDFSNGDEDDY